MLLSTIPAMLYALATLLCWTCSAYGSSRVARVWGSARANRYRLLTAVVVLAGLQLIAIGPTIAEPGLWWFLLGGVCHLGLGDIALYGTYRTIGPRLGTLVCLCLAAPISLVLEWVWLGTVIPLPQIGLIVLVIIAVLVALAPTERLRLGDAAVRTGLGCGLLAAIGQSLGAVVTRQGYHLAEVADVSVWAFTGALYRTAGGLAALLLVWGLASAFGGGGRDVAAAYSGTSAKTAMQNQRSPLPWLVVAAIIGPVVGIAAYQAALEALPAAKVQATLVCLPVTMVPVAWLLDGDRPSWRSLIGGVIAVVAVIGLLLL